MKKIYSTLVIVFSISVSFGQIAITQSSNSQTLSQLLAGSGVTISNYSISCAANGSGTFTNTNTSLGMPGGVILASGKVTAVPNTANVFASTQFTASGDAQLSTLTTGTIYDPCILQFDIVPQGPLLKFDYAFASEEYPEWVCSKFNDVFGFFITGPNPGGGNYTSKNIALIPGTNLPVAINTVNPGTPGANANGGTCTSTNQTLSYSSLYTDNLQPTINPNIVYDGITHLLTATAAVTPCQTYHLKIAIADVADRIYDSGVFLSAYSFNANPVSVSAVGNLNYAGFSSAYEGCVGGTFTLTLSQAQTVDMYVNILVSGTATNGVDYTAIPSTIMIPAGQTSVTIPLTPLSDGLTETMESVTIATLNPCTGAVSSSATINIRDDIATSVSATDSTLCLGQSTQLDANGGITYSWTPTTGLSNPNIKNPIATPTTTTTYTCTLIFGGCTRAVSQTIYVSNPANAITANPAGVICNGGTVLLTAAPSNGATPYSYLWSTGSTTPAITVATGSTYNVTATDAYGCSASATKSVTISNLAITGTSSNVSCVGGTNGGIDITVTGVNAPFTYDWGAGVVSQDRNNLLAGTYTVTAGNTVGCSVTASYTITQPAANLTSTATNTPVICNGGNSGSINLTPNGGVTPYAFAWSNGATTEDINLLTAGPYSITITDFNGCTTSRTVNITQPTAIVTSETHINENCFGESIGSIDLTSSGGTGAHTYAWSNGAVTQDISSLSAGTYSVIVADANGCTVNRSINVTQPAAVTATPVAVNPNCFGNADGSISLTAAGGTSPYTYLWSNAATTQNISTLTIGAFTVTITDTKGCTGTASATLAQPAVLAASATGTNVNCNGGNNGTITTAVSGGTTPYTYLWTGGATTANRTTLTAGTYSVTVTDSKGCTATASATITQPAALGLTETHTNVSCNGGNNGSIDITAAGGTSPYTYNWGAGVTTEDRNNISAGNYTITVTDTKSCTATLTTALTQPAVLTVSFTSTNPICNGASTGSISTTASGGTSPYTFVWNDGNTLQNRTALAAGTYTITATDNKGCSATGSKTITQPSVITITPTVTNATCAVGNNGTITIAVAGGTAGYTYNWAGGITTQNRSGLVAGTYPVTVTDAAGCTVSLPIAVSQNGTGISLTSAVTNVTCNAGNNGAIDITVIGGTNPINYNWAGGVTTEDRTALTAGTYSVTVTDGLGCSAISTNNLTQPSSIVITKISSDVLCNGAATGSITIAVSGGTGAYAYNWGGGITTQNRTGLAAGTYTVTVSDANLCNAASSTIITQPAAALSASSAVSPVSCFGGNNGSVSLTVTGGVSPYLYNWNNGNISQNLNNVTTGTYTVTVSDINGCAATATAAVSQPSAALNSTLTPTAVLCNGSNTGSITNSVTGGTLPYTFVWNDAGTSQNRTNLTSGNYSVTVTDNKSCTTSATTSITQPAALAISFTPTNVSCNGGNNGSITATVTGGVSSYSYNWGAGITTANRTALSAGTYTLTVTDANSCTASASVTITQPSILTLTMNSGTSVCANATGTATAVTNGSGTSPYNYLWSNSGANTQAQNGLAPGPISVTVTDANACSVSATIVVGLSGNNTNAAFTFAGTPCGPNATINFLHTGSNNVTHYWDFGNGSGTASISAPSYTFPAAGTFQVNHIVTRGFCLDSVKQTVVILPKPVLSSANSNVSCNGMNNGAIDLSVASGTPAFTYNWGGGITTQDRSGLAPGTYTVTVTDATPCSASFSAIITQPAVLTVMNTNTNVTCNGGNNGAINLSVTGGTPAYAYNWGGGITTSTRTGLTGGNYTVTVTDANLCSSINTIQLYQPNAISITTSITNPACNGQSTGAINLSVAGGTGAYAYNWGGGITTPNRTLLSAGIYIVTVTDANGCAQTASATLTQPNILSTSLSANPVACMGGSNGNISTVTNGGTAPFSYTWNDGNTNENRYTLSAGTYTVSVIDLNGCSATASTSVTQPTTAVNVAIANTTNLNCFGDSIGTINITATGGVPGYNYAWSDGNTSQNRTNLQGGNYQVSVSDSHGCQATAAEIINQPAQALSIDTMLVTNVLCYGNNTGSINTTVSGGTAPYTYNWGAGVTTPNRANLTAGTYSLTVTDYKGCSVTASTSITQPAAALSAATAVTNIGCAGGSTGAIDLTVTGGTMPYYFNWGSGINTEDRTNIPAGTYNVVITDTNNCTISKTTNVAQSPALTIAVSSSTNVSCFGGNNGAINITAAGGTPAYGYNWTGGITTQNRTGLAAGTYQVTVTDASGCSASASATITQPAAALSVAVASSTNILCFGNNTGAISITAAGGTPAYGYNWGGGITTQNRTGLTAGTYNVTVTDAKSCTAITSATITQPASALSVAVTSTTNILCFGGNAGTINITAAGGTPAYGYNWTGGITTQNRTGLTAGTYNVTVTDANSCSVSASAAITQPASALNIAIASATNVSCFGGNNGAINITATGGTTAYSYNWGGGIITQNRNGLAAGTYQVTVTDANSCSASTSTTITQPASALSIAVSSTTNVLCYGANTGSINTTVSGGTTAYAYNWGGGITTQNRTGLAAGTYNVTVTDAKSCTATTSATITQPASALSVAVASTTNILCFGGSAGAINITAAGGTPAYGYNWGGGIATQNRTGLTAGTYNVTVTDANSCSATTSATITQPASALTVAVSSSTNISCFSGNNGAINITAAGGTAAYAFNWGSGIYTQNRTGLTAGTYNVTVTDGNSCSATTSATITQPASALTVAVSSSTNILCFGSNTGAISITAAGGTPAYGYNWGGGITSQNRTGLTAGTYNVTVTDANSCSASTSAAITQPASALSVAVSSTTNILCFGGNAGAINITATGGTTAYNYNWGGGITTQNRTGLTAGTYNITVTDANACSASTSAAITQPASALAVAVSSSANVACFGGSNGSININATGGTTAYNYNWGNGITTQNRTGLAAGTYQVTVTDAHACSVSASATITQPASALTVTVSSANNISCFGGNNGSVNISVTGGTTAYNYNWGSGITTQNRTGLTAGTYNVTVTDAKSCSASTSATITQAAAIQLTIAKADPLCLGTSTGNINTTVTGGVPPMSYLWNTGGTVEDPQNIPAGSYSVLVTDNNGCSVTGSATLSVVNPLTLTETHTNVSCSTLTDANIYTQVSGGLPPYHFSWNTGATSRNLMGISSGSYSVAVTDSNGCAANINAITVTEPALLGIGITSTNVACVGTSTGSVNVSVNGGTSPYQYHWNNNATSEDLTNAIAGTYSLTVTDVNGCTQTASAFINTLPQLTVSAAVDQLICANSVGGINLTVNNGTAPYTYLWSTGAITEDINNVHPGTYSVIVRDANNCPFDTAFVVTNQNNFSVNATGGGTITLGQFVDLHVSSNGSAQTNYNWSPTFGMDCSTCTDVTLQPGHSTLFTVVGVDTNGCEAKDTVSITVIEDHDLFTPNAFSPNGDGNNDVLQLYGNLAGIKTFNIMIFDRWGEKVFEANEPTFSWDGIYKGELLGPTVCVFVMKAVFLDGKSEKMQKGSITILR